jgi:hypothetical protein
VSTDVTQVVYGSGQIEGTLLNDKVCIGPASCVDNMQILLAERQSGLDGLAADGIVGMSPSRMVHDDRLFVE